MPHHPVIQCVVSVVRWRAFFPVDVSGAITDASIYICISCRHRFFGDWPAMPSIAIGKNALSQKRIASRRGAAWLSADPLSTPRLSGRPRALQGSFATMTAIAALTALPRPAPRVHQRLTCLRRCERLFRKSAGWSEQAAATSAIAPLAGPRMARETSARWSGPMAGAVTGSTYLDAAAIAGGDWSRRLKRR